MSGQSRTFLPRALPRLLPVAALVLIAAADALALASLAMATAAAGHSAAMAALLAASGAAGALSAALFADRRRDMAQLLLPGRGTGPAASLLLALLLLAQLLAIWLVAAPGLWFVLPPLRVLGGVCRQLAAEAATARASAYAGQSGRGPVAVGLCLAESVGATIALPVIFLARAPDSVVAAAMLAVLATLLLLPTRLGPRHAAPLLAPWPKAAALGAIIRLSPFASVAMAVAGGLAVSAGALLPDLLIRVGFAPGPAAGMLALAHLAAAGVLGCALLAGGRLERRLAAILVAIALAGAAILPFGAGGDRVAIFALIGIVAGSGLLSRFSLDHARDLTLPGQRLPVLAGLAMLWLAGGASLAVPIALLGTLLGAGGALFACAALALAVASFGLYRMTQRPPLPLALRSRHRPSLPGLIAAGGLDLYAEPGGAQLALPLAELYGPALLAEPSSSRPAAATAMTEQRS